MACEETDKIYCCITLHSYKRMRFGFFEDTNSDEIRIKQSRQVYCKYSCPEDCVDYGSEANGDNIWVTSSTGTSCETCDKTQDGCEKNLIVTFDLNTCETTEHILTKAEYDSVNFPSTMSILYRKECVLGELSSTDRASLDKLIAAAKKRAGCSDTGACCYVGRDASGSLFLNCSETSPEDCTAANIQKSSPSTVLIKSVRFTADTACSDVNCDDMLPPKDGYCKIFDESTGKYTCVVSTEADCKFRGQFFLNQSDCESSAGNEPEPDPEQPKQTGACCIITRDKLSGKFTTTCVISTESECSEMVGVGGIVPTFYGVGTKCENVGVCSDVQPPQPDPDVGRPKPKPATPPPTPKDPQPLEDDGGGPIDPSQRNTDTLSITINSDQVSSWNAGDKIEIYDNNGRLQDTATIIRVTVQ